MLNANQRLLLGGGGQPQSFMDDIKWAAGGQFRALCSITDKDGNLFVGGTHGSARDELVVLKLSPTGALLWGRMFSVATTSYAFTLTPKSMATDSAGNVYICSRPLGPWYLFKLDPSGNTVFQRKIDLGGVQYFGSMLVDSSQNIYLCGCYASGEPAIVKLAASGTSTLWSLLRSRGGTSPKASSLLIGAALNAGETALYAALSWQTDTPTYYTGVMKINPATGAVTTQNRLNGYVTTAPTIAVGCALDPNENFHVLLNTKVWNKYDSSLNLLASKTISNSSSGMGSFAVDRAGNFYAGGGSGTPELGKYDANGKCVAVYTLSVSGSVMYNVETRLEDDLMLTSWTLSGNLHGASFKLPPESGAGTYGSFTYTLTPASVNATDTGYTTNSSMTSLSTGSATISNTVNDATVSTVTIPAQITIENNVIPA